MRELLAAQLPRHAHLPLERVASGGTENVIFRLGDELAVRLPMQPGAVGSLLKEFAWLPVIAPQLGLEVPEFLHLGEPDERYPFPWALVRWLEGTDAAAGRVDSLTETARILASFITELHAIDASDAPRPGDPGFGRGGPLVDRDQYVRDALEQCAGLIDIDAVAAVWDAALAAPPFDGEPVWLHADLLPTNLLVRDGRLAGILDFGTMSTGDPAYDITTAWHVLEPASRRVFRELLEPDDATWLRAQGLVVSGGVIALPYYLHTNPTMVAVARRGIGQVLGD